MRNHGTSITWCFRTGVIFIISSEELLTTTEYLVKQLFDITGPYRGLPAAMLFIGEEFLIESNDPLSVQAMRLSRWLQAGNIAEKWSVFPDRVLVAESASKLLQGLLERTRHTEAFLRDEMCPEIADMRYNVYLVIFHVFSCNLVVIHVCSRIPSLYTNILTAANPT